VEFENIGGNARISQHSLYDYSENPFGETIMSIEIHRESKSWWLVGTPSDSMNLEHMKALHKLLSEQIGEVI